MPTFTSPLLPIQIPSIPENASADDLARFAANFTSNIVNTGNSLLQAYLDLKETDFFAVGDIPELGPTLISNDMTYMDSAKQRPSTAVRDGVDFAELMANIDRLAALSAPAAPSLTTPSAEVPELTAVAPAIVLPAAPNADVGAAPAAAPSLESPLLPDAPSIVLPAVPTLEDLRLPEPPAIALPEWSLVAPQNLLAPPTVAFDYVDPGYASVLHDPLVQKLLNDLSNGSYGIEPGDETALWFRARDRAAQAARAEVDEAVRRSAGMSFPMPQGSMLELAQAAEEKAQNILTEANRDIALKRADLYVEGRKFTIQQVKEYEQVRINLYNATQERALNYAKAVVEMGIAVYDATVRNYNAQLEAYRAEAQVFATRIQGELAKAQVFRTQVEAEAQRMQYNKARIDAYQAQLQGITTTVELYRSRLGASQLFMQLQSQKVDLFRAQVQAYAEQVRAKEAEFGIYRAQIEGQRSAVDVFRAQIDAHNAQLGSTETKARIALQSNESLLQQYRAQVTLYQSQLDSFARQISARLDEAKTRGALYSADIDSYRAYVDGAARLAGIYSEGNRVTLDWERAKLGSRVAKVEHRLRQLGLGVELQKSVNKDGMEFLRTALGAATSGINALGVRTDEG